MKEIIAIINRKGGCGKTTTAQALAGELKAAGYSTLLIDLDSQCNLSASMDADFTKGNITQLLDGIPAEEVIQHTINGDIVTGSKYLAGADLVLQSNKELKKALRPIVDDYDYIILDTPASYGRLSNNALEVATSVIIPVQASVYSLQGIKEQANTIEDIQDTNEDLIVRGILITRYDDRSNDAKEMLKEFEAEAAKIGTRVLYPAIRNCVKTSEAQRRKVNLNEYAPKCTTRNDYKQIAEQIINEW